MNEKDVDDYLDQMLGGKTPGGQTKSNNGGENNGGWKEININNRFAGMLPSSKEDLMAYSMQQQHNQQQSGYEEAFIKEGFSVYKAVSGMNIEVDLATQVGNTSELNGKKFVVRSKKKFLIVKDYSKPVDLSRLDEHNFVNLVVIEAPFVGKLLVPEQAIRNFHNSQKAILKG